MGIHGNGWGFFPWDLKKLSERAAKYTARIQQKAGKEFSPTDFGSISGR